MLRSLRFRKLTCISRKGAELGHMLLLNSNRKPYMESPMTLSYLTLKGQSQDDSDFKALYPAKGAELGHVVTIKYL